MKIFNLYFPSALVFIFCLIHFQSFGQQNISGKVIYKIGFSSGAEERIARMQEASTHLGQEQDNFIAIMSEVNEKIGQYEFELQFNSAASLYQLRNEVVEDNLSNKLAISTVGGHTTYFKDLSQQSRIEQKRYSGQLLNVIMEYDRFAWNITRESKMIGQYLCYKAEATMVFSGKFGEEVSTPITAWFTISIPAPYGPQGIDGLPGLILEATVGESDRYIYASKVTISHIGFISQTTTFSLSKDSLYNPLLLPAADTIQEVEITASPPAIIRKPDTIIFNIAAFASGNERKLKELLLQLPGVEVDANNAVYFNGQRIEKLLVEGRLFFGGNSELAVKSVPADAVEQVEILEGFNNVSFLSGLANQNDLALNVKLKEDKKNFVFGSLQAGGGFKDRYQAKADLFYYSPKLNINSINELNNIDERPISSLQSLTFNKLLAQGRDESLLRESQPFLSSIILDAERRIASQNRFSALDLGYELTDQLQGNGFIIYASNKDRSLRRMSNQFFLNNDLLLNENRTIRKEVELPQGSLDFKLNYSPSQKEEYSLKFEGLNQSTLAAQNIQSQLRQDSISEISNGTESSIRSFKIGADWHKEYNEHFTGSLKSFFTKAQDFSQSLIRSDQIISSTAGQDINNLVYLQDQVHDHFSLDYTGYYKIDKSNHLVGAVGHGLQDAQLLLKNEYQGNQASSGSLSTKQISTIHDTYLSLLYKHQINLSQLELGGAVHHLQWQLNQLERINRSVWLLLPRLKFSTEITNLGEVNLSFRLNSKVPDLQAMNDTSFISNFNSIRTGNPFLIEELSQEFSLNFSRYNIITNSSLFFNGNYQRGIRTIQPSIDQAGINQRFQYFINTIPTNQLFFTSRLNKIIKSITISPSISYRLFDYTTELNDNLVQNLSQNISLRLRIRKKFKQGSQVDFSYSYQARQLKRQDITSHFFINELNVHLSYQITESLLINSELIQYFFQSSLSENYSFTNLKGEIRLSPQNSRWIFAVQITNALDNAFFANTFIGDSFVTVDRAYVFPRVLLASVSFDL